MKNIKIKDEYIKLGQAMKLAGLVSEGFEAKLIIADGKVKVGGEKYIHIKVHVPLPNVNKPNQLLEQHKDKTLADPL